MLDDKVLDYVSASRFTEYLDFTVNMSPEDYDKVYSDACSFHRWLEPAVNIYNLAKTPVKKKSHLLRRVR